MAGDYITDAVNLFLERLDRVVEALERIADALEAENESQQ
jgi:hypothetical protein